MRKIALLALIALGITCAACWPSLVRYAALRGLLEARSNGANLTWNGLSAGFTTVALDSLTIWIPGPRVKGTFSIPVSLELQQISAALRPASLLVLSPKVTFSTNLYGGVVSGEGQGQARDASMNVTLSEIELGKHPQLSALGIRGGRVNGVLNGLRITPRGVEGGKFSTQVRELALPEIDAVTTLLRARDLGGIDVDTEGEVSSSAVRLSTIRLSSLFGSATGELTIANHLTPTPSVSGSVQVSLSERGSTTIGPWLPLIPGAGLDAATSAFEVSAVSVSCSAPNNGSTVLRQRFGCVKLAFRKR